MVMTGAGIPAEQYHQDIASQANKTSALAVFLRIRRWY